MKIPAGVDEGTRIRVAGEGEAGVRGAASGDLYLFVHMKRHPIYAREGTTLIADCPVSFTTAALGGSISLPGLDGAKVEIKIPAGIQSGEQLRQRGAGMSVLNGRGRGDLVARILVETPTRMSQGAEEVARGVPRRPRPATNARRRRASSAASAKRSAAAAVLQPVDLEPQREHLREQFRRGVELEARLARRAVFAAEFADRLPSTSNGTRMPSAIPRSRSCSAALRRGDAQQSAERPCVARSSRAGKIGDRRRRPCRRSIAGKSRDMSAGAGERAAAAVGAAYRRDQQVTRS